MAGNVEQLATLLFWGGKIIKHGDLGSVDYSEPPKTMCFLSHSSRHDELMTKVHTAMNTNEDNTRLVLFGRYPMSIPGGQIVFVSIPLIDDQSWQWFLRVASLSPPIHVYAIAERRTDGQGAPLFRCILCRADPSDYDEYRSDSEDQFHVGDNALSEEEDAAGNFVENKIRLRNEMMGARRGVPNSLKVNDVEEWKQKRLKVIFSKLTPQNLERVFEQVRELNIDNADTLAGFVLHTYNKAVMEPAFCEMFADISHRLYSMLPEFSVDNNKLTFKRLLLNCCQAEFERGGREQAEADTEFASDQEKRIRTRRMLGNIKLIGELYKKRLLAERIMHACIRKLLGVYENPDEEDIESLCHLMHTIGESIDHSKAKERMDMYFEVMLTLSNHPALSSRLKDMLIHLVDLRKNNWQQTSEVEGSKMNEDFTGVPMESNRLRPVD